MNNKNNQIRNKIIKSNGKNDDNDINTVRNYIRDNYHITPMKEWYIGYNLEHQIQKISGHLTYEEVKSLAFIDHPDLLFFDKLGGLFVVEIDGKLDASSDIHRIKTEKTAERNQRYKDSHIKYIIIDAQELELLGKTWEGFLDESFRERGISKKV